MSPAALAIQLLSLVVSSSSTNAIVGTADWIVKPTEPAENSFIGAAEVQ